MGLSSITPHNTRKAFPFTAPRLPQEIQPLQRLPVCEMKSPTCYFLLENLLKHNFMASQTLKEKQGQINTSSYTQITTPNMNASFPQGFAMLISQRNVHGKRISTDMEVEDVKAILNNHYAKRHVVSYLIGSPYVKDFTLRNGYQGGVMGFPSNSGTLQKSPTPCSITPQGLATTSEKKKKTPSPCLKGGKTSSNLRPTISNPFMPNGRNIQRE